MLLSQELYLCLDRQIIENIDEDYKTSYAQFEGGQNNLNTFLRRTRSPTIPTFVMAAAAEAEREGAIEVLKTEVKGFSNLIESIRNDAQLTNMDIIMWIILI